MRGVVIKRCIAIAALVILGVGSNAPAHAGRAGIVIESYAGDRPEEASRAIRPLVGELAVHGFVGGGVAADYEARVSRPAGRRDDDLTAAVERGRRAWIDGQFEAAISTLGPAVESAVADVRAAIEDPRRRPLILTALIVLALSQHRLGQTGSSRETFAELVRSFPDAEVASGVYGPEAAKAFDLSRRELAGRARGRLRIAVDGDRTEVFVNERAAPRGSTSLELAPGSYRIVARTAATWSRVHAVSIAPGSDVSLAIDPAFEAAVRTDVANDFTALVFPTRDARRQLEARYAAQVGDALDAKAVVVVGLEDVGGRPSMVGALVMANGRELRRASTPLGDDPTFLLRARALARFLAGEPATADVVVEKAGTGGHLDEASPVEAAPGGRWRGWPVVTGVGAIAAAATGIVLLSYDGDCKGGAAPPSCPDVYDTTIPAWTTIGVGAALTGLTIYLIATRPTRPTGTAFATPAGDGMVAGWITSF